MGTSKLVLNRVRGRNLRKKVLTLHEYVKMSKSHSDKWIGFVHIERGEEEVSNALNRPLVAPLLNCNKEAIGRKCESRGAQWAKLE